MPASRALDETRIPLAPAAVALLRWLPARESRRLGEAVLVFAGRGNRPVGGWTDVRRALLRAAGVSDGTLHDIRRTVVSTLADHGWEPAVVDRLLGEGAAEVKTGVLLAKDRERDADVAADYVGFRIADEFVVGYGLDYQGRYRNLPYVGVLKAEAYA